MSTRIYLPTRCKAHRPSSRHPECPERIVAIDNALSHADISGAEIVRDEYSLARDELGLAHEQRYVDSVFAQSPTSGIYALDADTLMDVHTLDAALVAAGTAQHAVNAVCCQQISNAFCAVRPPGHHAEIARGMGFCFFNSIALAALLAIRDHGIERVAILDFDVHHGNGTQDICAGNPHILFCSSYQYPCYPHQNDPSIAQRLVNVPLSPGTAGPQFRAAIEKRWWPELRAFQPDLILVSAGFDAHRADPLADLLLETDDFAWLGEQICGYAEHLCDGRVVAVLEGGYDLAALASSATAFVESMAGNSCVA